MRILGISGSLRKGSYNTQALKAAQSLVPEGSRLDIYTLHDIPLYNGDVQDAGFPDAVLAFGETVARADAVLICSPEYNYSVPGVLKNALDWLSRLPGKPLEGKPVAIMGASPGRIGTARMQYHLRQVLLAVDARVLNRPEVMIAAGNEAFADDGSFVDERTTEIVGKQLAALVDLAHLLRRA